MTGRRRRFPSSVSTPYLPGRAGASSPGGDHRLLSLPSIQTLTSPSFSLRSIPFLFFARFAVAGDLQLHGRRRRGGGRRLGHEGWSPRPSPTSSTWTGGRTLSMDEIEEEDEQDTPHGRADDQPPGKDTPSIDYHRAAPSERRCCCARAQPMSSLAPAPAQRSLPFSVPAYEEEPPLAGCTGRRGVDPAATPDASLPLLQPYCQVDT